MQASAKIARIPDPAEVGTENPPRFAMRHFSVAEIAEMWGYSDDFVRKLFEREPGVLAAGHGRSPGKRRYLTLRIPLDVAERVYRRLQNP